MLLHDQVFSVPGTALLPLLQIDEGEMGDSRNMKPSKETPGKTGANSMERARVKRCKTDPRPMTSPPLSLGCDATLQYSFQNP